jgi:catechol 2,3-dioxygenase-like lactoylglutathione lyase family enzyme
VQVSITLGWSAPTWPACSSAHLVFESGYVELPQLSMPSPGHHLATWVSRHFGLHILAFGVEDIDAAHERCVAAGLPVRSPAHASRAVEYGARHGEALEGVYVVADDVAETARRIALLTGAVLAEPGVLEIGRGWLRVLTPHEFAGRFPGSDVPRAPCLAGFTVRAPDRRCARESVIPGLIAPVAAPGGGFWVDAAHAGGCVVEFAG